MGPVGPGRHSQYIVIAIVVAQGATVHWSTQTMRVAGSGGWRHSIRRYLLLLMGMLLMRMMLVMLKVITTGHVWATDLLLLLLLLLVEVMID